MEINHPKFERNFGLENCSECGFKCSGSDKSANCPVWVVLRIDWIGLSETRPLPCMKWRQNEFESRGAPIRRFAPEKFFGVVPSTVLALKVQLVILVSAFAMVSTFRSVACLLFFYPRCPHAQPFVKVGGGTCPPCPMVSALLLVGQQLAYINTYTNGCAW